MSMPPKLTSQHVTIVIFNTKKTDRMMCEVVNLNCFVVNKFFQHRLTKLCKPECLNKEAVITALQSRKSKYFILLFQFQLSVSVAIPILF